MSRKVFYTDTPQRRRIKQEAILILRQTRGLIDNELLERAREQITSRMKNLEEKTVMADLPSDVPATDNRFEKIDRQKNMATILKFIEMKSDNKSLMQEMRTILQQSTH